jgi:hypothetical protein
MKRGMETSKARRVRLTGQQLKTEFLKKYTRKDSDLVDEVILVKPLEKNLKRDLIIKAGSNWQFRLGRIPEVEMFVSHYTDEGKVVVFKSKEQIESVVLNEFFLRKYAFKSNLFVARKYEIWQIFCSADIIDLLQMHCSIRILETGRIKFDYFDGTKKVQGLMTIEYRSEPHKKSFVFGAHGGGAGEKLRQIIESSLIFTEVPI